MNVLDFTEEDWDGLRAVAEFQAAWGLSAFNGDDVLEWKFECERRLGVAMGLHRRLGRESMLGRFVDEDVMRMIMLENRIWDRDNGYELWREWFKRL